MTDTFLIHDQTDSNPANWSLVSTLLSSVSGDVTLRALEWTYEPYTSYVMLGSGKQRGLGYPKATWIFPALRLEQRENLRDYCTGISSLVYIRTPTNETTAGVRIWDDFSAIMHWVSRPELSSDGLNYTEQVEITFTNLVPL